MSKLNIEEIKARLEAATPGPWTGWGGKSSHFLTAGPNSEDEHGNTIVKEEIAEVEDWGNAVFIQNAPTDIAALIERVEELEGKLAEYQTINFDRAVATAEDIIDALSGRLEMPTLSDRRRITFFDGLVSAKMCDRAINLGNGWLIVEKEASDDNA
jgi:hypothetical protein